MKRNEIRDLIITGSYMIVPDGKEPVNGWKDYANKLEDILIKNNGILPNINNSVLLDENNDIDTVGKCANCGVEFHIHKNKSKNENNLSSNTFNSSSNINFPKTEIPGSHLEFIYGHKKCQTEEKCSKPDLCIVGYNKCHECGWFW